MVDNWEKLYRKLEQSIELSDINEFIGLITTTIESKLAEHKENLDTASLDEFRNEDEYEDYRDYVSELWNQTESTKMLASELSIVALYKRIEIHSARLTKKYLRLPASKKIGSITELGKILPFNINSLSGYLSFDELRLLNNSIKHEGHVSKKLASEYSAHWVEGFAFGDLTPSYSRLVVSPR
jgi:hypothetical protein